MTPSDLSEQRLQEAYEYAKLGERLSEIQYKKAQLYPEIRDNCKSIAEADREWELSELGLEEKRLKTQMKCKEQKISALRTKIETANNEMRNQY